MKVVNKHSYAVAELDLDSIRENLKFLSTMLHLLRMLLVCLSNTYVSWLNRLLGSLPHPHTS